MADSIRYQHEPGDRDNTNSISKHARPVRLDVSAHIQHVTNYVTYSSGKGRTFVSLSPDLASFVYKATRPRLHRMMAPSKSGVRSCLDRAG
jgi:hypothetical protein